MNKSQIIDILLEKGVLSNKTNGRIIRPFCWKKKINNEINNILNSFLKKYKSEDEGWFCLIKNIEPPICPICKKDTCKFVCNGGKRRYNTTCNNCSANKVQDKRNKYFKTISNRTIDDIKHITIKRYKTLMDKYGTTDYMQYGSSSFKKNLFDKYGSENYNNIDKIKQTCLDKYGYVTNLLIPEVHNLAIIKSTSIDSKNKRIQTVKNKYGYNYVSQVPQFIEKNIYNRKCKIDIIEKEYNCILLKRLIKKYGQGFLNLKINYLKIGSNTFVNNEDVIKIINYHNEGTHTNGYTSKLEKQLVSYIRSIYDGEIVENDTSTVCNNNYRNYELDVYLPQLKLALDFNGVYWHSIKFKDKFYHSRKTECCRRCGIKLIHVFEDVWNTKNEYIKKIILECIQNKYNNIKSQFNNIIRGDNNFPIPDNCKILKVTEPKLIIVNKNSYYDSGEIYYRKEVL